MLGGADLAGAAEAALAHVDDDEEIAAVIPCDPRGQGAIVFLCALRAGDGDELTGWIAIDEHGHPVHDEDSVRRAASIVALCETAEEAAGIPEIDALVAAIDRAREQSQAVAGLSEALAACDPPARALAAGVAGVRIASDAYVDSIGRELLLLDGALLRLRPLAERLSSALSGEPGDPGEPLARAVWEVVGRITQAGGPARLADQVGAATGAIEAFADDVVLGYRHPLDHEEHTV
ncbi:MAG TPA: hypothetical protein VGF46_07425 [Gaiellales bacterium]